LTSIATLHAGLNPENYGRKGKARDYRGPIDAQSISCALFLGIWGHAPRKIVKIRYLEIESGCTFCKTRTVRPYFFVTL